MNFLTSLYDSGKTLWADLTGGNVAPSQPTEAVNPQLGMGSTGPAPITSTSAAKTLGLSALILPFGIILAVLVGGYFLGRWLKWW